VRVVTCAVDAVELLRIRLPLVRMFRTAHGTTVAKEALLVRVRTRDGADGWSECAAEPEPRYSYETIDTARSVLRDHLVPRVLGRDLRAEPDAPIEQVTRAAGVNGHPMAKAALEVALLDARLRTDGIALAAHLGARRTSVDAGIALGMEPDTDTLCARAEAAIAEGYRRVKIKIEPGADVDAVEAVRERIGPHAVLQVDANGSYSPDDREHHERLRALDAFGLACIEQPLPPDRLLAHAALARTLATPICLDESITSAAVAGEALDAGACSVVNVKVGRVGGIGEAVRVHDLCSSRGVAVWCGGMLETGIGRAVNVALAALPGFTMPGDLSPSARYFAEDLTEPFVMRDGRLPVPAGPGIGVEPRREVLAAVTLGREILRPTR
jgi:O-succinylbenzoate synthase